jgi:hypothetical protein
MSSEYIYVTVVEALRKKERGVQNRMKLSLPPQKNGARFAPLLNAIVLFCTFLKSLTQILDQTSGFGAFFTRTSPKQKL